MRTEKNKDGTRKVWMTRDEFQNLLNTAKSTEIKISLMLMGNVGLRVSEVLNVSYRDIRRTSDGEDFILEVDGSKDSTGEYNGGKQRDVYLPDNVERVIFEYMHKQDLETNESIISVNTERSIQYWIQVIADQMADKTDNPKWEYLSCHDLRRSLVTHLIHNAGVQLSIVQNQMGWSDISTVKNYLDDPTEDIIQREFSNLGI